MFPVATRSGFFPGALESKFAPWTVPVTDTIRDRLGRAIRLKVRVFGTVVSFDVFDQPNASPPVPGSHVTLGLNSRDLPVLVD
jgi:hypothetical protein